jgi:uncharacterized membrane protein YhaH (DUF805 family)
MFTKWCSEGDGTMADMGMQDAVRTVFGKYADFSGRARRQEYWWFNLFAALVSLVLAVIGSVLFHRPMGEYGVIATLWSLATLLPSLAVAVRRMHDVGRSGWWLLIAFVPLVGALVILYWFVQRGTVGPNEFGPDPVT